MKVLTLNLKKEYFDAIKCGSKKEEYRELKNYWTKRLKNRAYDIIEICLGYPSKKDTSKRIQFKWNGYIIDEISHKNFNNEAPTIVYAIDLKERIS